MTQPGGTGNRTCPSFLWQGAGLSELAVRAFCLRLLVLRGDPSGSALRTGQWGQCSLSFCSQTHPRQLLSGPAFPPLTAVATTAGEATSLASLCSTGASQLVSCPKKFPPPFRFKPALHPDQRPGSLLWGSVPTPGSPPTPVLGPGSRALLGLTTSRLEAVKLFRPPLLQRGTHQCCPRRPSLQLCGLSLAPSPLWTSWF